MRGHAINDYRVISIPASLAVRLWDRGSGIATTARTGSTVSLTGEKEGDSESEKGNFGASEEMR